MSHYLYSGCLKVKSFLFKLAMGGQEIEKFKGCDRRTVTNSMPKLSVSAYNNKSLSINTQL